MRNISLRHSGAPNGNWRSLATITAAAFATQPTISRSIIDLTARRLEKSRLAISPRSVAIAMASRRQLSDDVVTAPPLSSPPMPQDPFPRTAPPDGYDRLTLRIKSVSPLVMHNGQLADQLNPIVRAMKRVSGKRAKTDADYEQMAKLEFLGSLYLSGGEPCIPGHIFEACLTSAAKKGRRGMQAKAGIICDGNFALEYIGPRSPEALWSDDRFRLVAGVRVGQARVMRTRPIFRDWSCTILVDYLPDQLNAREIVDFAATAGRVVGLCDWRPKFGRFNVES
jgi:hypothetical protein